MNGMYKYRYIQIFRRYNFILYFIFVDYFINYRNTWDEHIFELTLPRSAAGRIGHVDVRYSLHSVCQELPSIQITLLKQNIKRIGHHEPLLTPVDERIDFNIGNEQKGENPVVTEEFQRQHNTEILCGPIDLHRSLDLSWRSGCVTLTSPKLFRSKARTLLVHMKALIDPTKDNVSTSLKCVLKFKYNIHVKCHFPLFLGNAKVENKLIRQQTSYI